MEASSTILGDVPFGMTVPVLLPDSSDRSEPNATLVADLGLQNRKAACAVPFVLFSVAAFS